MRSDARAVIFIIIMERKNVYGIEHCFVYVFFYGGLILMTRNICIVLTMMIAALDEITQEQESSGSSQAH